MTAPLVDLSRRMYDELWNAGRYEIDCSEFCGSGHGRMKAALVSVAATRPVGRGSARAH